jgi:hypothetical protein
MILNYEILRIIENFGENIVCLIRMFQFVLEALNQIIFLKIDVMPYCLMYIEFRVFLRDQVIAPGDGESENEL